MLPFVSVVVPHLNQTEALASCIRSLDAQSYPRDRMEWIVVDNGSRCDLATLRERHPDVILLAEPQPGPGLARNRGVAAARGEILAFIDADCRAHEDWVRTLVDAIAGQDGLGPVGGDVRIDVGNAERLTALESYESVFAYRQRLYIERHGYSGTGNLAMAPEIFTRVGPFGGIAIAEDADWGKRSAAAGRPLSYVPGMIVYHPARALFSQLQAKWRRHVAHQLETHRAAGKSDLAWLMLAVAVLLSVVPHTFRMLVSDRLSGARNRLRGLPVLLRIRWYRFGEMLRQARHAESAAADWNRV